MIMKLGNLNIDEGSNILAKNRDSPWSNEGVIFLSTRGPTEYLHLEDVAPPNRGGMAPAQTKHATMPIFGMDGPHRTTTNFIGAIF